MDDREQTTIRGNVIWDEEDKTFYVDDWLAFVFPNADGEYHHGTRGSIAPDRIVLEHDDSVIAICDGNHMNLPNYWRYDSEYFMFLRLLEVVDSTAWNELPWKHIELGEVFYAWDKFHHLEWSRTEGQDDEELSYGGDWSDFEDLVHVDYPLPEGHPYHARNPKVSDAILIRAVRSGDAPRVKVQLDAGANPNAGIKTNADLMPNASVSHSREASALFEAVSAQHEEIVDLLLAAGADVDGRRDPSWWTPLRMAVVHKNRSIVERLVAAGADTSVEHEGKTLLDWISELAS